MHVAELGLTFLMCVHGGEVGVNRASGVQVSGRHLSVGSGLKVKPTVHLQALCNVKIVSKSNPQVTTPWK